MKALEIGKHQSIDDLHAFILMHSSCVRLSAGANRQDDVREGPSGDVALTFALWCCVFWRKARLFACLVSLIQVLVSLIAGLVSLILGLVSLILGAKHVPCVPKRGNALATANKMPRALGVRCLKRWA